MSSASKTFILIDHHQLEHDEPSVGVVKSFGSWKLACCRMRHNVHGPRSVWWTSCEFSMTTMTHGVLARCVHSVDFWRMVRLCRTILSVRKFSVEFTTFAVSDRRKHSVLDLRVLVQEGQGGTASWCRHRGGVHGGPRLWPLQLQAQLVSRPEWPLQFSMELREYRTGV